MGDRRFATLNADIAREIFGVERLVAEMEQLLQRLPQSPSFLEVRAAGSILHDFYSAIERAFRQIALQVDGDLPGGGDFHTLLLRRMDTEIPTIRPAVITAELGTDLEEYLRFRHLFRNIYGFDLKWERMDRWFAVCRQPVAISSCSFEHSVCFCRH